MTAEESVRALAKRLRARHPGFDPVELDRDPDFARAVELLVGEPQALVESLTRKRRSPYLAAMALAAITARAAASRAWTTRMVRAPPVDPNGLAYFLFGALAAAAEGRVLRPLLYRIVPSWVEEPLLGPLGGLVEARLAAGESFDADDFAGAFVTEEEPLVLRLVDSLPDPVQAELRPGLRRWQRTLVGEEWFRSFARIPDPSATAPATLVGDRTRAVALVLEALTARPPRSVLLVGEHGTGKRTLAREAVRRLDPAEWFVFEATAADVIAGQQYIGDVEGRLQEIGNRCCGRRAVWLFPSFGDALWAGQWSRGPRGVLDRMLPLVHAGDVAVVGMVTPAAHELIRRVRPPTAEAFDAVRLRPPSPEDTLRVAHDWLETAGVDEPDDLADTLELATHYLPAVAPPGNLIRLLRLTRDRTARDGAADVSARRALETLAEATGLPLAVLDPAVRLDVDGARAFFTARVLGQPEAVDCLVERIAMVKAGLADPTRPLGVFLFVGPTGTGKTEIAKALAEYLFGSPDRLVRLDMSEYQTWESFERLLAAGDERGEASPLLASVRAQPFSVILLDEFEKAARPVHDLFLQVFDDGRLTDRGGRTADFRHCVIVLTSNAGSAIRVRPGLGFSGVREAFDPGTVERAVESRFRPEFLNRLDRVVVFRPLGREVMRSLLGKELAEVLSRRGLRSRPWAVEWDDAALDLLIERGFSEQYGARPLRRAVERHLLAPLALTMAAHEVPQGEQFLFISARDGSIDVSFVDPDGDEPAEPAAPPGRLEQIVCDPRGSAEEGAFLRAELARVEEAFTAWSERKDELLARMRDPGFWTSDARVEALALVEVIDRFDAALGTARSLADRLHDRAPAVRLVALLANRLYVLDRALNDLERGETGDVLIAVRPRGGEASTAFARELASMYEAWAERRGMRIEPLPLGGDELAFGVSGLGASTMLAGEPGLHVLELPREGRSPQRATAGVAAVPGGDGGPERLREALSGPRPVVRRYRRDPSPLVRDAVRGWRTGRLDRVLGGDFDVIS